MHEQVCSYDRYLLELSILGLRDAVELLIGIILMLG